MQRDNAERYLECLDAIDKRGGRALPMDFYRIGGNQRNQEKLIETMLQTKVIVKRDENGSVFYEKTEIGQLVHELLKQKDWLGPLFEVFAKKRLRLD